MPKLPMLTRHSKGLKRFFRDQVSLKEAKLTDEQISGLILYLKEHNKLYTFLEQISSDGPQEAIRQLLRVEAGQLGKSVVSHLLQNWPEQRISYKQLPPNCTHIKIAYQIWEHKGNINRDPTEIGRKIKKMHLFVQKS